jgi:hypothetical protein
MTLATKHPNTLPMPSGSPGDTHDLQRAMAEWRSADYAGTGSIMSQTRSWRSRAQEHQESGQHYALALVSLCQGRLRS